MLPDLEGSSRYGTKQRGRPRSGHQHRWPHSAAVPAWKSLGWPQAGEFAPVIRADRSARPVHQAGGPV